MDPLRKKEEKSKTNWVRQYDELPKTSISKIAEKWRIPGAQEEGEILKFWFQSSFFSLAKYVETDILLASWQNIFCVVCWPLGWENSFLIAPLLTSRRHIFQQKVRAKKILPRDNNKLFYRLWLAHCNSSSIRLVSLNSRRHNSFLKCRLVGSGQWSEQLVRTMQGQKEVEAGRLIGGDFDFCRLLNTRLKQMRLAGWGSYLLQLRGQISTRGNFKISSLSRIRDANQESATRVYYMLWTVWGPGLLVYATQQHQECKLLTEVCKDVECEPHLQQIPKNETYNATAITGDEGQVDSGRRSCEQYWLWCDSQREESNV